MSETGCVFCSVLAALERSDTCPAAEAGQVLRKIRDLPASVASLITASSGYSSMPSTRAYCFTCSGLAPPGIARLQGRPSTVPSSVNS